MSKKTKIFLVCSLFVILLGGFVGCKNLNRTLDDCVSEVHEAVFCADDDNFFVEVVSGKIKKDFALDGRKNELQDFVSIKLKAKKGAYTTVYADFSLKNTKYSQQLTLSPIDDSVWTATVFDVCDSEKLSLSVLADDKKIDYTLEKVQTGQIKPIDLLKDAFEDRLMDCFDGESFNCEVSVRLVKSPDQNDKKYYWYIVVYTPDKNYFGLMADSITGEIVAKKS